MKKFWNCKGRRAREWINGWRGSARRNRPTKPLPPRPEPLQNPHALAVEKVTHELKSNSQTGLSRSAVAALIEQYGYNELAEKPPEPAWKRLARQFNDLTIWILFAAACIAVAFGEWMDGAAILAIVILNGLLGFVQENRAGRALLALRKMTAPQSRVIRDGVLKQVPAPELVPGDRVE